MSGHVVWVGSAGPKSRVAALARALDRDPWLRPADARTLRPLLAAGGIDALCGELSPEALARVRDGADEVAFVALGTGDESEDLALLEAGADEVVPPEPGAVGSALERARARRRARERSATPRFHRHNVALALVAKRMRECADAPVNEQVRVLTEVSAQLLCVARTSVWLYDEKRSLIRAFDVYDARTGEHEQGLELRSSDFPAYFDALREERVIAAHDALTDPATQCFAETYLVPLGIGSLLDAPVREGDQVLGVLCHEHIGGPRRWTDEDMSIAAGIADFVALAFEAYERRRVEESLRKSQAALEQARRVEAVGRLAGGVAHDFNNMLTVILSYAEILRRKLGEGNPLTPIATEIARAGHHASDMTRKLLAVSRRDRARPRVVDLALVVRDMEEFLHRLIGEDVELALELAEAPAYVEADPGQLEQLLLNLAVNARDAMPDGGKLTIAVRPQENAAVLEVTDTGVGMPPEVKERIFEPFFTTKPAGKGTGLGLFTVFGIVRESAGTIDVRSAPGKGTTFEVRFPLRPSPESAAPRRKASSLRGNETILLVEDEEAVGEVVRSMLVELGYHVLLARGGEEALAISRAREGPIDLLVSDVVMPNLSGPVLAERIRAERPGIRVIFVSGYADETLERYGARASGSPLLAKPFTREMIGAKIRQVLGGAGEELDTSA